MRSTSQHNERSATASRVYQRGWEKIVGSITSERRRQSPRYGMWNTKLWMRIMLVTHQHCLVMPFTWPDMCARLFSSAACARSILKMTPPYRELVHLNFEPFTERHALHAYSFPNDAALLGVGSLPTFMLLTQPPLPVDCLRGPRVEKNHARSDNDRGAYC